MSELRLEKKQDGIWLIISGKLSAAISICSNSPMVLSAIDEAIETQSCLLDEIDRLNEELTVTQERCDRYEENMSRHGLIPVTGAPKSEGE